MSDEPRFTIRVYDPGTPSPGRVFGDFALEGIPERALLALRQQVEREIQDRAAIRNAHHEPGHTRWGLDNNALAARIALRQVRQAQRILFVLTDEWPHVDLEP